MSKNQACPAGTEITSVDRCQQAAEYATPLGLDPKRSLQSGNWAGVPFQCSAQVKNDDTFTFSTNDNTDNRRFVTGEFVMICEKGMSKNIFRSKYSGSQLLNPSL